MSTWCLKAQTIAAGASYIGEPCEMVQSADDLYVGQVVSLATSQQSNPNRPFSTSVRFAVLERFNGIGLTSRHSEILTRNLDGVSIGQRYLVYVKSLGLEPFMFADKIATLIPLGKAETLLDYLRRPSTSVGQVTGYVEDSEVTSTALLSWAPSWAYSLARGLLPVDLQQKLLRGARLRLETQKHAPRFGLSNGLGRFQFGDLRPGAYYLSIDDPRLTLRPVDSQINIVPGGCTDLYLQPLIKSVVMGQLVRGVDPIYGLTPQLLAYGQASSNNKPYSAYTHGAGWFEFSAITPGDYLLAVDALIVAARAWTEPQSRRFFYPGVLSERDATVIHVETSSQPITVTFQLPPLQRRP